MENVIIIYICFPTGETGELPAIWPSDSSREGTLQASAPPAQGAFSSPERSPTGRPVA